MSFKKSKLDLLVRVRYSNPLPAPPCPPKLLDIPTDYMRYARTEFLNDIASETPLPMIVDAECGMPLDLGQFESLWQEDADDSALNPDPENLPALDPKDQFLLLEPSATSTLYSSSVFTPSASGTSTPVAMPHVSWLRKTEYLSSRDPTSRTLLTSEPKHLNEPVDVSHSAQLRDIEASFAATDNFDLTTLKHPNKPEVTAEMSYEVFPDDDIWANAYDLFRFSERPGDRPPDVEDPRLDCAILRPMESDGDHFLAYYLTEDDGTAVQFKTGRAALPINGTSEDETAFHFVRDYEVVKVDQEVPNELLLVIDDGEDDIKTEIKPDIGESSSNPTRHRPAGAYYKGIERKMLLKKRRVNTYEPVAQKWDVIRVKHVKMDDEEENEREELRAEVADPGYMFGKGDVDAEGEVEEEIEAVHGEGATNGVDPGDIIDPVDVFGE